MPYEAPTTSPGSTTWCCYAKYGDIPTVSVTVNITIGDSATAADADAALQDVVNALNARSAYTQVQGVKSYKADTTQVMDPS
ncbi:hypothetical protein ABZ636_04030 [Streptomyces sp. NPDC007251]|uniref:hypothetical protein n=1 Tax=Streptomyces sp. NPDC007251 TaxID=3154483 RepID=UPI003404AB0D